MVAVLRTVHDRPGIERATIARELNMTSGFLTETVARLSALELVSEQPAPPTGERGRPTTTLHPHPLGPLVVAVAISHEKWQVAVAQLGGSEIARLERAHRRDTTEVLNAVRAVMRRLRQRHGLRIRAVAVAVPGTVLGNQLAQAANLGWNDIDLTSLWPGDRSGRPFLVGNDASFAAAAEARRGAAVGATSLLHLYLDAGIGGAVIDSGNLILGATGTAGEFGHMPLGDPSQQCRCGAWGCWNTTLDGAALARALNEPAPVDEVTYSRHVLAAARTQSTVSDGRPTELGVVQAVARSVGRGAAGLVNAFDPDVVTLGGLGRELLEVAGDHVQLAYAAGLMAFRASAPPLLIPAHFGEDAPLLGAAEEAFSNVLTDYGLVAWSSDKQSPEARGRSLGQR
jgi:predicted NBD/HSP70 family sugar kinase